MKRLKIRPIGPFRGDWRRRTGPRAAAITALCWIARLVIRPQPPDGQPLPFKPDLSIVIIKPIALGDVLRATVFVNALRRCLPNARITFAVGDYARAAIDNNPDIDEILPMQSLGTPRRYDAATYVSFVRRLRERSFDVAFVLDRSPAMALLPFFARIPYRVGLDSQLRGFAHTTRVSIGSNANEIEMYRRVAAAANINPAGADCVFRPTQNDNEIASRLIEEFELEAASRHVIIAPGGGINPGAVDVTKRWPADRFASVADDLIRTTGSRVSLVGTASDATSIAATRTTMVEDSINLEGRTSLGQLAALITRSDLVIANDSSVAQLALCVGTPCITIFTSTESWIYGSDAPHAVSVFTGNPENGPGAPPSVDRVLSSAHQLLSSETSRGRPTHPDIF